ncbi:MAG: hypothetical protein IT373_36490 [Polyangiaceae bacterium]|nr:hypothetical protein [Polyangiaceae bacterium]
MTRGHAWGAEVLGRALRAVFCACLGVIAALHAPACSQDSGVGPGPCPRIMDLNLLCTCSNVCELGGVPQDPCDDCLTFQCTAQPFSGFAPHVPWTIPLSAFWPLMETQNDLLLQFDEAIDAHQATVLLNGVPAVDCHRSAGQVICLDLTPAVERIDIRYDAPDTGGPAGRLINAWLEDLQCCNEHGMAQCTN